MDCDQVFMILTRGPFPTGEAWDEDVEVHLETCGDCWRLAEALRPALEVFQEAVPPAEGRDLPGYWGDARPSSTAVAQLVSRSTRGGDTLVAPEVEVSQQTYRRYLPPPLPSEISLSVLRAMAIAATVTAAAVAVFSLLHN
jgi:hypothetical protein